MRNLKVEELFFGAWVNNKLGVINPTRVIGIGGSNTVSLDTEDYVGVPSLIQNVYPLQIDENLLRGFGFKKTKGDNVWLKQIGEMRLTIGLRWRAGVQICRRCAISGKIACWNEEIRYMHELQRWWNDRVYFPFDFPLDLKWHGVTEKKEEIE